MTSRSGGISSHRRRGRQPGQEVVQTRFPCAREVMKPRMEGENEFVGREVGGSGEPPEGREFGVRASRRWRCSPASWPAAAVWWPPSAGGGKWAPSRRGGPLISLYPGESACGTTGPLHGFVKVGVPRVHASVVTARSRTVFQGGGVWPWRRLGLSRR